MTGLDTLGFSLRYIPLAVALLGSAASVYTDVRWGKIKNYVTLPMIFFGWLWAWYAGGLKVAAVNVLVSCFLGLLSCLIGRIGEGDIKLIVGVAACLQPLLGFLFLAFFFVTLAAAALFVRFKIYGFRLKPALTAMKTEAMLELSGINDANVAVHGRKVRHLGGPVIFLALVFCLIKAKTGGLI